MYLTRFLLCIGIVSIGSVAQAGVDYKLQTFNASNVASGSFTLGDTVTVKLVASQTAGSPPTLGTDLWYTAQTMVTASTSDLNDATGFTTIFPTVVNNGANFDAAGGRRLGGQEVGGGPGIASTNNQVLYSFTYTANVLGNTTIGFDQSVAANNAASLIVGGNFQGFDTSPGSGMTVTGGTMVSVSAVPEPSSLMLLSLVTGGLAMRRSRRKAAC